MTSPGPVIFTDASRGIDLDLARQGEPVPAHLKRERKGTKQNETPARRML